MPSVFRIPMLLGVSAIAGASFAQSGGFVPGQVLVKFKPSYASQASQIVRQMGGSIVKTIHGLDIHVVKLGAGKPVPTAVQQLRGLSSVKYAEPNYYKEFHRVPNDPEYPKQYAPRIIGAEAAWDRTTGKSSVLVAIIDSGVDMDHPDLVGNMVSGYDFGEGDADPNDDVVGHGTHVAGIAAAHTDNGIGIAGVGWNSKILPLKIATAAGGVSLDGAVAAIKYAADRGAKVINMSFGGYGAPESEREAVDYAWAKGSLLFASSGNDGISEVSYPAGFENVISVGATDSNDLAADFSNFGPTVDIAAPGVLVQSTVVGGGYEAWDGTSMSCPVAAGAAALLFSYGRPGLTNVEVRRAIETTAKPMPGFVEDGRIDVGEAIKRIPRPVATVVTLSGLVRHSGGTVTGNVASARYNDGATYSVAAAQHATLGAVNGAIGTFTIPSTVSLSSIDAFELHQKASGAVRVTNIVYLYNWSRKAYEVVRSTPMTKSFALTKVEVSNPGNYVNPSTRQVRVLTRGILPKRLQSTANSTFNLAIDEIKLGLSTTE